MNYLKIYKQLVVKRLRYPSTQLYTQVHHIIPRSIDPSKTRDQKNLVKLSAREHFIAHALLVKITQKSKDKSKYFKMLNAFIAMSKIHNNKQNREKCFNSILYAKYKQQQNRYILESGCLKGQNSSSYNTITIYNSQTHQIKHIKKYLDIPEGWVKGKPPEIIKSGKESTNYGTKWIYNTQTLEQKLLRKNQQIEQGWVYGISPLINEKMKLNNKLSNKDKIWITNLELKISKPIYKNQQIPDGWLKGRIMHYDHFEDATNEQKKYYFINYKQDIERKIVPRIRKKVELKTACIKCGKETKSKIKNYICRTCKQKLKRREKSTNNPQGIKPTREMLQQHLKTMNYTQISIYYGVADNTIRRWCKEYGLKK